MTWVVLLLLTMAACPSAALAHHAKDYLVTGSYDTLHQGQQFVYVQEDYALESLDESGTHHGELTPGWIYGLADTWQLEVHTHLVYPEEDEDGNRPDVFLESLAPSLQYRLPEQPGWWVNVAVAWELELPTGDGKRKAGTETQVQAHLLVDRDWGPRLQTALDLHERVELEGAQHTEWGMALATKLALTTWASAGMEFLVPADGPGCSLVPGIYLLRGRASFKAGVGIGLTSDAPDLSILSMISYRF